MNRSTFTFAFALFGLTAGPAADVFAQDAGGIYYRPDGRGYYYHAGPSNFRPPLVWDPITDEAILNRDLERREYERSSIVDTGLRHGNLTPEQKRALVERMQQSAGRDSAYQSGYYRGRDVEYYGNPWNRYPQPIVVPPQPVVIPPYRTFYRGRAYGY